MYKILITGGAGFIGSNLVDALLSREDVALVRVMDNFSTGSRANIEHLAGNNRFELVEADICDYEACLQACTGIDLISHQAALGSVPRSIKDPLTTNHVNITGTLHIFNAAREKGIQRVVYAASSSTYGNHPGLPKVEDAIGEPLSPYAVTKYVNELYAKVFARLYNMQFIGLRYFNIFGPRQNPEGPYAAVIPLFMEAAINGTAPVINGDGLTSRDFTFVANAVTANQLALFTPAAEAVNQVYNIACGEQTTLVELYNHICQFAGVTTPPVFGPERAGDVKHSLADISKATQLLGYQPAVTVKSGLEHTYNWYQLNLHSKIQ